MLVQMMDPACAEDILPLFLRPNDPYCAMIDSQITSTTNVVLKITVPKRTGRKRKRGSDAPFLDGGDSGPPLRLDAGTVFRTLNDNVGKYHIEPVGAVNLTHRYRGLCLLSIVTEKIANVIAQRIGRFPRIWRR